MTTTTEQMRAWTGPAILTFGFRPFFLGAAVWAALAMALWVAMLSGHLVLPTAFDPVSWHAHEFLYGYLGAAIAGFLMTAVPNWTGRLPIVGWRLGLLACLWVAGRVAVAISGTLPPGVVAVVDLAFPMTLALVIGREIVAGRNWRNLIVLGMLSVFIVGNALFHWDAARGAYAAQGHGLRLGLGAGIMMIAVIGGRVVPSFTRNWLVKRHGAVLPSPPMQGFDKAALLALLLALMLWVVLPVSIATGVALALAGGLHSVRLARWKGHRTLAEPLVTVLHAGYAFVQLGAVPPVALWASVPVGALATAILVVNNLRDRETDVVAGKRTLAVRFGRGGAIAEYMLLIAISYATPTVLFALGLASPWIFLPAITLPWASMLCHQVATRRGRPLNDTLARTAQLLLVYGVLFAAGLAL